LARCQQLCAARLGLTRIAHSFQPHLGLEARALDSADDLGGWKKRKSTCTQCPHHRSRWLTPAGPPAERCFGKLKQFRAVATRYDKREFMYQGTIDLASIRIWLRDPVS
jgi:transposase